MPELAAIGVRGGVPSEGALKVRKRTGGRHAVCSQGIVQRSHGAPTTASTASEVQLHVAAVMGEPAQSGGAAQAWLVRRLRRLTMLQADAWRCCPTGQFTPGDSPSRRPAGPAGCGHPVQRPPAATHSKRIMSCVVWCAHGYEHKAKRREIHRPCESTWAAVRATTRMHCWHRHPIKSTTRTSGPSLLRCAACEGAALAEQ